MKLTNFIISVVSDSVSVIGSKHYNHDSLREVWYRLSNKNFHLSKQSYLALLRVQTVMTNTDPPYDIIPTGIIQFICEMLITFEHYYHGRDSFWLLLGKTFLLNMHLTLLIAVFCHKSQPLIDD